MGSSETEKFRVTSEALTKGSVYGSFILIRIVDPGNGIRCDLFLLRGVVSVAGHFVDAAGGYSNVDSCWNIRFVARTGTCGLKCVIPMEQLTKVRRACAKQSPDPGDSTASPKATRLNSKTSYLTAFYSFGQHAKSKSLQKTRGTFNLLTSRSHFMRAYPYRI